jgi:hypothetical protein
MHKYSWICSVLIAAGAGCASSQAEQVRDARMAQIDDQTVAKTRAIEDRQEAREDDIEHRHDLAAKRVDASNRPDESAAKKQLDIVEDRSTYESKAQGQVETIGVRIQAAQEKLGTLGSAAPIRMQTELKALERDQRQLEQDLRDLPNTPTRTWEDTRNAMEDRISRLNSRVKDLTSEIEDAP